MFEEIVNKTLKSIKDKKFIEIDSAQKIDHQIGDLIHFQVYTLKDPKEIEINVLAEDLYEIKRKSAVGMTSTDECIRCVVTSLTKTNKPASVVVIDKHSLSTKEKLENYNPSPIYALVEGGELVMMNIDKGVEKYETYVFINKGGAKLIGATISCFRVSGE